MDIIWHQRFYIARIQSFAELLALIKDEPIRKTRLVLNDEQTISPDKRLLLVRISLKYLVNAWLMLG
jgi:hypothetical protein